MRYFDDKEGIAKWINEILSPALSQMPGCSIKSLEYRDIHNEFRSGQYIKVTYDDGYSREVNVTLDSAKACMQDLIKQHAIE